MINFNDPNLPKKTKPREIIKFPSDALKRKLKMLYPTQKVVTFLSLQTGQFLLMSVIRYGIRYMSKQV